MNQAPLEILLLGPVEIKFQKELLKINRRIERAILYALALEHKPVSRTKLIDLLWPEADQSDPRASLRTALSRLRNELPDPKIIRTDLDQVSLNFDQCFVDIKAFEDHYEHLKHLLSAYQNNRTLPTSIVNRIQKALDLWRGNTILSGDNLERYQAVEILRQSTNNKLNHRRKFLMGRLADHYRILGQDERALSVFMELAKIDFTDITSQCAALDILISLGRHQDAINYCDTLENIYEHEYNAPLPNEILSRCQRTQYKIDNDHNNEQNQWSIPLAMNLPLIGRQTELYQLHQAFSKGGFLSIQGEMGIGKTRLVKEFFETLSTKPNLFVFFCREMETSLPFSPIISCLRNSLPDDIWKEIDPVWISQLSLLLPELTKYIDENEQRPFSKLPAGKQYLFDALLNVCQYISKNYGKILFFIDNAHWADRQTLQVVAYFLSQGFFNNHSLLIIASRPEEKNPDLDNLIDQAQRLQPMQIINLTGLDLFELKNLAGQVLERPPSEAFISKLLQETGGNPFLALEIIRTIQQTTLYPEKIEEVSNLPLPNSIQAIFRKRFLALDEEDRNFLQCAAVLGDNLSLSLLETVTELNPSQISKAIDPLLNAGFLQSTSNNDNNDNFLHFSNEIMREVVLNEAPNVHIQILHRQIAQRMASDSPQDDKAAIIANHYILGGDTKKAFPWLLKAAEHAWVLGSQEDAQNAYQKAEKLTRSGPDIIFTNKEIIKLYRQWSDFAYESHQVELVEKLGAKLQYIGNRENHPLFLGTSKIILSDACFLRLDFETGLTLLQEGIKNLEIAGDEEALIKAIKRKGVISWWTMNYDDVVLSANQVLQLTPKIPMSEELRTSLEFNARHLINMMQYTRGQAASAIQTAQKLYNTYFHKLEPFDRLRSLYLIGYSSLIAAEFELCEDTTKRALEITRPLGNGLLEEVLLIILARAEFIQGKLNQAYQHGLQALKAAEEASRKLNIIAANCLLGDILYNIQNFPAAAQHYRVAQIREGFSTISFYGIENSLHLAHMLAWTNQVKEAREIIQRNNTVIEKCELTRFKVSALMISGICDFHESQLSEAEIKFKEAIQISQKNGLLYEMTLTKLVLARLLINNNKLNDAENLVIEALKISRSKNLFMATLYGYELLIRISKAKNQVKHQQEYQAAYQSLMEKFSSNIQSEPLKEQYLQELYRWDTEHHFP